MAGEDEKDDEDDDPLGIDDSNNIGGDAPMAIIILMSNKRKN